MGSSRSNEMKKDQRKDLSRAQHRMGPTEKPVDTLQKHRQTVSVASLFKQKPQQGIGTDVSPTQAPHTNRPGKERFAKNKKSPQRRCSSRSPCEVKAKITKNNAAIHPLALSYKDASKTYAQHIYEAASLSINQTLNNHLHILHDSTIKTVSSDGNLQDPKNSPLKLTVAAKFEREANKIYQPISQYQIRMIRTNTDGKRGHIFGTIERRMEDYGEYIAARKAEVEKLKNKWEAIVGEIWKLGVQVLGEEVMEDLLFTRSNSRGHQSPTSTTGSTLFIPEKEDSAAASKKRVKFDDAPDDSHPSSSQSLQFLHQPSRLRKGPVRVIPAVAQHDIEELQSEVNGLGTKHITDLRIAEQEYHTYWKKKTAQIAMALDED